MSGLRVDVFLFCVICLLFHTCSCVVASHAYFLIITFVYGLACRCFGPVGARRRRRTVVHRQLAQDVSTDAVFLHATSKLPAPLDLRASSLHRGHASLLCIVPSLTDDRRRRRWFCELVLFLIGALSLLARLALYISGRSRGMSSLSRFCCLSAGSL